MKNIFEFKQDINKAYSLLTINPYEVDVFKASDCYETARGGSYLDNKRLLICSDDSFYIVLKEDFMNFRINPKENRLFTIANMTPIKKYEQALNMMKKLNENNKIAIMSEVLLKDNDGDYTEKLYYISFLE